MDDDDDDDMDINALIAEWDALQIRATGIVRRLEAAEARRTSRPDAIPSNAANVIVNGLKVGEGENQEQGHQARHLANRARVDQGSSKARYRDKSIKATDTLHH
jgi:hypothetical protein